MDLRRVVPARFSRIAVITTAGVLLSVSPPIDQAVTPTFASTQSSATSPKELEAYETGRHIVRFGDLAALNSAETRSWSERGEVVVDTLVDAARDAQARASEIVESTPGATYESFWVSNSLVVEGPDSLIERLRGVDGVTEIRPERARVVERPERTGSSEVEAIDIPWGVERVGAPQAWADGALGGGVVIASLDSGVQYDHPALVQQYRGHVGNGVFQHDYNWFDASGTCPSPGVPCDDNGHGTHTMGTIVGGDGPGPRRPDIGVSPAAQWISVGCGPVFCSDSQLMAAGEWLLAPTDVSGNNPDSSKRPDIINNSWGGAPGDQFFRDMVIAWRAAGIVPVFSAGNFGPSCGSGDSPGDYPESFMVGATDFDDKVAAFSGRGPSFFGNGKPDVVAPGVQVLSSVPGDGYKFFDGTSMAAPHVSGAIALVLSAKPRLRGDVDTLTELLADTATDVVDGACGGDYDGDPNNVSGDGRIDAAAATSAVAAGGAIVGILTDARTGRPVAGARLTATSATWASRSVTDESGLYRLAVQPDLYVLSVAAFGYDIAIAPPVLVDLDETAKQDFSLRALPVRRLSGTVRSAESRERIGGGPCGDRGNARGFGPNGFAGALPRRAAGRHLQGARFRRGMLAAAVHRACGLAPCAREF